MRLNRALSADPDFALAHIARGRLLQLQARIPKAAAAHARSLADRVTARDRRHIEAIALSIKGAAGDAPAMVRAHIGISTGRKRGLRSVSATGPRSVSIYERYRSALDPRWVRSVYR